MSLHVCMISPYIYPSLVAGSGVHHAGGAEIQQTMIARLLVQDGYRVSVLTNDFGQPDQVTVDGITIRKIPAPARRGIKGLRWLVPRLTDVLACLHGIAPDVVYVRTCTAYTAPAALYTRRAGTRLLVAAASDNDLMVARDPAITWRDWLLFRWGQRRATLVLAQNQRQCDLARMALGVDARLIPNFLFPTVHASGRADGPVIWVGTIRDLKRPHLFVELAARNPQWQFMMVGGLQADPGGDAIVQSVRQSAATVPNLRLLGFVPPEQVGEVFDGASVLVNTSSSEGFPNTFLHAWIRGVPSLSFVDPQIAPGQSGTVACSGLDDMSSKLSTLLASPESWAHRSAAVKRHFDLHHGPASALASYRSILGPAEVAA